jgi:hypothetical protein
MECVGVGGSSGSLFFFLSFLVKSCNLMMMISLDVLIVKVQKRLSSVVDIQ